MTTADSVFSVRVHKDDDGGVLYSSRSKNVLLLSTKHQEPAVSDREKRKPVVIVDYNKVQRQCG